MTNIISGITFSDPTLGLLVEIGEVLTRTNLDLLVLRADLRRFAPSTGSKAQMLQAVLTSANDQTEVGDAEAHQGLLTFVCLLLPRRLGHPEFPRTDVWFDELRESLLADGYELCWEFDTSRTSAPATYRLLPTDAPTASLSGSISALEVELTKLGYDVARNHYRQAVDNYTQHRFESSNGQLRALLEDLLLHLAQQHCGYTGPKAGGAALNHMVDHNQLSKDAEGKLLQGLWKMLHTNGSHPGQIQC